MSGVVAQSSESSGEGRAADGGGSLEESSSSSSSSSPTSSPEYCDDGVNLVPEAKDAVQSWLVQQGFVEGDLRSDSTNR